MDWVLVVRPMLPDSPNYDGGIPGVACRFSRYTRGAFRWGRTFFLPGDPTKDKYRRPCNERPTEEWGGALWDSAKRIINRKGK